MKKANKLIALTIIFSVICTLLSGVQAFAASTQVTVSNVLSSPGDEVSVEVSMPYNAGLISMQLILNFDNDALTLTEVVDNGILGEVEHVEHSDKFKSPYKLTWNNDLLDENLTVTGKLVTLKFKVNEGADPGEYPITVTSSELLDKDINDVVHTVTNGSIKVEIDEPVMSVKNVVKYGDLLEFDVKLLSNDEVSGTVYVVVYDEKSIVSMTPYTAKKEFNVPMFSTTGGKYVKVMWWGSELNPFSQFVKIDLN